MRTDDLARLRTPSDPTLSPDGRLAVFTLTRIDLSEDVYRSDLWAVPTDGSAPARRLTRGPRDTSPRFSPDGSWIAFLRATDDDPPQLHVMPADGGEPRQVGEHKLGASAIAWSPDSTRIAYVARVPEDGRYGTDEKITPEKEPPRRITTRKYRLDGLGWTTDRRPHVFVVDALEEDAQGGQLTRGDFDHGDPAWSHDGRSVAFVSARHDERDTIHASDLFVVPAQGGDPRQLTRTFSPVARPAYTPDGATIVFTAHGHRRDIVGRNTGIWRIPADGSGEPRRLTDAEAHDVSNPHASGDLPLLADDRAVTTIRLHRGTVELCAFPLDGGDAQPIVDGPRTVQGYARASGVTVVVTSTEVSAGELCRVDDGHLAPLTHVGDELARAVNLRPMEELATKADDGYEVHGWTVKPAGCGPFPVLLSIHGGPFTQYGLTLFDEAQVYAGAGYAVVMGNPRGSQGYGEAHGRAIVHAMGDRDCADLTALLDAALEDPDLDADRVGVMGGSYGGFMTTWLVGHSDRFVAAISERSLTAWDSFAGSSDIGASFGDLYAGDDPARLAAQSPFTYVDDISTPVMIIHSEQDLRCPLEQAQRLFERLKRNGVETEMLLFPGEGHELSRSGLPSHRVARFEAILDWWRRHLPTSDSAA
ncbi:MAG: S9 family peptidase [Euzebyales bacterium]|nr:S9 family peptidase [Euzebyales bacterium]